MNALKVEVSRGGGGQPIARAPWAQYTQMFLGGRCQKNTNLLKRKGEIYSEGISLSFGWIFNCVYSALNFKF